VREDVTMGHILKNPFIIRHLREIVHWDWINDLNQEGFGLLIVEEFTVLSLFFLKFSWQKEFIPLELLNFVPFRLL